MHFSTLLAATFVATALAVPTNKAHMGLHKRDIVWDIVTVTHTVYVTEGKFKAHSKTKTHSRIPTSPLPPPPAATASGKKHKIPALSSRQITHYLCL
jgi:hypothetical protein